MHWFFDYPWGPALTWLVVFAVLAVLAVSFWTIRREIWSAQGMSVIGLRLLALAIVVFLLLQPQTKEVTSTVLKSHVAVLVDTSKSMSVRDSGRSKTRFEMAKEILTATGGDLLEKLKDKGNVDLYQFSTTLEEMPPDGLAQLEKPEGDSTGIGTALSDAVGSYGEAELTSVVILTDGRDNSGQDPIEVAKSLQLPVFVVGIGEVAQDEEREERDYAVESVVYDRRVIVNRKTDVLVNLSSFGFPTRVVPVSFYVDGHLEKSTEVSLGTQRPKNQGVMTYMPTVPGTYNMVVKIPVEEGELDDQNNEKTFTVQVIDPVNRLLYIENEPRWEAKFINRELNSNRNINLQAYLKITQVKTLILGSLDGGTTSKPPLDDAELAELKVVIIGDVGRNFFTDEQIMRLAKFVESGGSLVLLGGKENFGAGGFGGTPLATVLPVVLTAGDEYLEAQNTVKVAAEGAAHPIFQNTQIDWSLAPPLNTLMTTGALKAGATTLLSTSDGRFPVVVVQNYGQGKAVVMLTDSTWKWKVGQANTQLPHDLHKLFWANLVEWLLPKKSERRQARAVELFTDKDEYELNERVHLIVNVTDPERGVARDALVTCKVQTPDKKILTLDAQWSDISAYSASEREGYSTSFTPHKSGKYSITAIAEQDGAEIGRAEVSMVVGDPSLEFRNTNIDEELLKQLAARSEGKYYRPAEAGNIINDVVYQERKIEETVKHEVWNSWWVLITFVALMTSEWIMRKKRQLA